MEIVLQKIRELLPYKQLLTELREGRERGGLGLPRAARLPIVASLELDIARPILFITDRADHALSLFDELGFWSQSPRYLFSAHPDFLCARPNDPDPCAARFPQGL
jgi:hypothetical protein